MLPRGPVTPPPPSPTSLSSPPPHLTHSQLLTPTSSLYGALDQHNPKHYGKYTNVREGLDWKYHTVPNKERQLLQDDIVDRALDSVESEEKELDGGNGLMRKGCGEGGVGKGEKPLALFTAGGMGAGKGHTLRQFLQNGTVRLPKNFVWVDPDSLARSLPERQLYLSSNPKTASTLLHPEASLLTEILSGVSRKERRSLVVDGSLSDCAWFSGLLKNYAEDNYDTQILFVFASEEIMLSRAERRASSTGRVTDPEKIKASRLRSPECVGRLARPDLVRRTRVVDNSIDAKPPRIVYDSKKDPEWTIGKEGGKFRLDVVGFVEGRLRQDEEGRVVIEKEKEGRL